MKCWALKLNLLVLDLNGSQCFWGVNVGVHADNISSEEPFIILYINFD